MEPSTMASDRKRASPAETGADEPLRKKISREGEDGQLVVDVVKLLIELGCANKLPTVAASDVATLYCFAEKLLLEGAFTLRVVCPLLLAAHHIRSPELLGELVARFVQKYRGMTRATSVVHALLTELETPPFRDQSFGQPFWTGYASRNTGTQQVMKWSNEDFEVSFIVASEALVEHAQGKADAERVMNAIQALPGCDQYGYHVLRSFRAVVRGLAFQHPTLPLKKMRKATVREERFAAQMSPHVRHLHTLIGKRWAKVTYGKSALKSLPYPVREAEPLDPGDQALLTCEVYGLLRAFHVVPSQKAAAKMSFANFVSAMEPGSAALRSLEDRLRTFQRAGAPLPQPTLTSPCRQEGVQLVNTFAPPYTHSAISLKNWYSTLK